MSKRSKRIKRQRRRRQWRPLFPVGSRVGVIWTKYGPDGWVFRYGKITYATRLGYRVKFDADFEHTTRDYDVADLASEDRRRAEERRYQAGVAEKKLKDARLTLRVRRRDPDGSFTYIDSFEERDLDSFDLDGYVDVVSFLKTRLSPGEYYYELAPSAAGVSGGRVVLK